MVSLEYLKMSPLKKFLYNFLSLIKKIPLAIWSLLRQIPKAFTMLFNGVSGVFKTVASAAVQGDYKTKISLFIMGFGQLFRGQILRGIIYLIFQAVFVFYMLFFGWKYLAKIGSLGEVAMVKVWDDNLGIYTYQYYDNSLLILLYSLLTVCFIIAFLYAWYQSVKQSYIAQQLLELNIPLKTAKDDLKSYANEKYHKTLLSVPVLGLSVFTIFPIIFMVFIAFTNYDAMHSPPKELFSWVGLQNFANLLGGGVTADAAKFAFTFREVLIWTVIWAIFSTFSNYILGMLVAILINKKGIKFKKLWRTVLVFTIAVPQFVSLMLTSQMLKDTGIINHLLQSLGIISSPLPFLTNGVWAKVVIIVVNVWIGIPYTMLICTGILLNIPADLYESAKIDGAGPIRAYFKITLPYMLHVTAPYLISQFIANLNNFNVIFLLTGGAPDALRLQYAGETDLLITWLYKLTFNMGDYKTASVISIFTFIIVAVISLILYNRSNAVKNEEIFM
ncbi:MAG: sugar ABC transporter permease [Clostridiales bacterium]|nr:sugar ABC transporter permease [Clostridiales bacterium]